MIKPVRQQRSSSGHVGDVDITSKGNEVVPVDKNTNRLNSVQSKWKIYKNALLNKKINEELTKSNLKPQRTEGVKISSNIRKSEISNKIPKSDKNWIRIQVKYDEKCKSSLKENSGVSQVTVNYEPDDFQYNENAVDVPAAFIRNQCNYRSPLRRPQRNRNLKQSIQEFLREDWIFPENDENKTNPILNDSPRQSKFFQKKFTSQFDKTNRDKMGVKLGVLCHHSVAPLDPNISPIRKESQNDKTPPDIIRAPQEDNNVDRTPVPRMAFENKPRRDTYPELFQEEYFVPPGASSSIEWDNILHKRNNPPIEEKPQTNRKTDSATMSPSKQSQSSSSPVVTMDWSTKYGSIFKSFSGSVQSLVKLNKNGGVGRPKSASENNLSKLSERRLNKKSNKFSNSSFDIDYCPSVLYNRKQIAGQKVTKANNSKSSNLSNIRRFFGKNLPKALKTRDRSDS